ncbi:MAG: hypothetical protein ABEL76_10880, partial [Bradymonadaceae bacterium]
RAIVEAVNNWDDPERLAGEVFDGADTVLFAGASGTGKSALAESILRNRSNENRRQFLLDADPGTPTAGPPGAVVLAELVEDGWQIRQIEGLATLDAGRYRLALVDAVARLSLGELDGDLAVDAPGLHRGRPAREFVPALYNAAGCERAIVVGDEDEASVLTDELVAGGHPVRRVRASAAASKQSGERRARQRTERWDEYLEGSEPRALSLGGLTLVGDGPPVDMRDAWPGRQVALIDESGSTLGMAEVEELRGDELHLRSPVPDLAPTAAVLARDARRNQKNLLRTDRPNEGTSGRTTGNLESIFTPTRTADERLGLTGALTARAGMFRVSLIGGFFGNPVVHVETLHGSRRTLIDLGQAGCFPTSVLNQVEDVFVTHAHLDHFAGFTTLLATRIYESSRLRIWGPPGIADRVASAVDGFTWDRLGEDEGPVFDVREYDGESLRRVEIRADEPVSTSATEPRPDGELLEEDRFRVRAALLDHGTPVLAFAFEERANFTVRSDRVGEDVEPGPWLGELKRRAARDDLTGELELPGGERRPAEELVDEFLSIEAGERLVYATDFTDTARNRRRVERLADGADSAFAAEDVDRAERSGHLTTSACAEIAAAADVERLIPFHFSSRYEEEPERLYREILDVFARVEVPKPIADRME